MSLLQFNTDMEKLNKISHDYAVKYSRSWPLYRFLAEGEQDYPLLEWEANN
jgi:hypothetical protein